MWNDGKFPKELTSRNLYEKHHSKPYNPLIAQTFFKAGFIEAWGRGFEKIKEECNKFKTPLPEIEINDSGVMIKCLPSKAYIDSLSKMQNLQLNIRLENNTGDNTGDNVGNNVGDNTGDNTGDNVGVNETQRKILEVIEKDSSITQSDIARELGINKRTIERNISILKENKILARSGNNKKGIWKIIK